MSRIAFTPESLFRVSTLGAPASGADPWVVPGAHLRAWVPPALGFPLHPFTLWPVRRELLVDQPGPVIVEADVIWWVWRDGSAEVVDRGPQVDVGRFGTVYGDLVGASGQLDDSEFDPWFCWIRVEVDGSSGMRLDVVSRGPAGSERTLLSRTHPPFALGASHITRIRLTGDGQVVAVFGLDAARLNLEHVEQTNPVQLGLPFDEDNAWYVGAQGAHNGLERAERAAPLQAGPPDRPEGGTTLDPADEVNRVQALTSEIGDNAAANLLEPAYADPGTLPSTHRTSFQAAGPRHPARLEFGNIATLLTGAADAGLARWLGLAGIEPIDIDDDPMEPLAWVSAGIWAVDLGATVASPPPVRLNQVMEAARFGGLDEARVEQWDSLLHQLYPDLERIVAEIQQRGFEILTLVAPAGLGAPPDLPGAPDLALDGPGPGGTGQWETLDRFTQRIRLRGPRPTGPIAFARTVTGQTISLHETVDTAGPTISQRALTMLPGRADGPAGGEAVLTSRDVPGTTGQVSWRVAIADEFGRWGPPGELSGDPPPRPPLPEPNVEAFFTPNFFFTPNPDPERDVPGGPRSPGEITVQVAVPAADQLAPGTLPITTIRITVGVQAADNVDVTQLPPSPPEARLVIRRVPAPATQIAQRVSTTVTVVFDDGQGGSSQSNVDVSVVDQRRPPPIDTAPTLLWASRRDPTGQAELALTWPVAPGQSAYRVYVGDERALATALELTPPIPDGMSRAERAERIFERADRLTDRKWFTLAADPPMPPAPDGRIRFSHRLPGSLRTIQFVRVVPLTTPDGVEAPFAACGLVPVAVPGDDRPPAPALAARPDQNVFHIEVRAGGVNEDLLARLQPAGQEGPEFRLRRTRDLPAAALYLPVVTSGTLYPLPGEPGTFAAELTDPADGSLPPFVRHTWVAEVRYPPEIAVKPGAVPVATPVQTEWALAPPAPQPSEWSAPSAPVSAMLTVPIPPISATVTADGGSLTLSVDGAPVAHPDAVGPWRLRVWRRTADGDTRPLDPGDPDVTATPDPGPPPSPADGWVLTAPDLNLLDRAPDTATFTVALVDPLGQAGPLTNAAPG